MEDRGPERFKALAAAAHSLRDQSEQRRHVASEVERCVRDPRSIDRVTEIPKRVGAGAQHCRCVGRTTAQPRAMRDLFGKPYLHGEGSRSKTAEGARSAG